MAALPMLPEAADTRATPLSWFLFDKTAQAWVDVRLKEPLAGHAANGSAAGVSNHLLAVGDEARAPRQLTLLTWNVDAFSPLPQVRLAGILAAVRAQHAATDVLFLQEVSRLALDHLLADAWVRRDWYVSDAGAVTQWMGGTSGFSTVTLVSRRFGSSEAALVDAADFPVLGALWRVNFPSLFGRYAICCEIKMGKTEGPMHDSTGRSTTVIRLANVHLDSLQIRPSKRPRQLEIIADILHQKTTPPDANAPAAHGLVAGDFNPVLPDEDEPLVAANGLVDAWKHLHPGESGFTWGIDGKQPYPPARLDRVAVVGLEPVAMGIEHPGNIEPGAESQAGWNGEAASRDKKAAADSHTPLPWSDHSGLWCRFQPATTE